MHDIEPYYHWIGLYSSSEDRESPLYGKTYSEFTYSNRIYNYYIHPQWDEFGSSTLYLKILYVDYDEHYAMLELIGEWNDCLNNDIMLLKRNIIEHMINKGIVKFVILSEHILNFHGSDDCYYEEWREDVADEGGWICFVNTLDHVWTEMETTNIHFYTHLGPAYNNINWRKLNPGVLFKVVQNLIINRKKEIYF